MIKPFLSIVLALLATTAVAADQKPNDADTVDPVTSFLHKLNKQQDTFGEYRFLISPAVQDNPDTRGLAAQMLATELSFLGRPNDAIREFPIHNRRKAPVDLPAPTGFTAMRAADWIAGRADQFRVVMVNEAHHVPQTRLLTLELLSKLRAHGFAYLAVETLDDDPGKVAYPTRDTGYYTREPVFAELIREAVRLGYTLVPYEAKGDTQQARETGQAKHISELLAKDPEAKILVHAGYGHIGKDAGSQPGGADPMALELMRLSKLPVLSIDQTELTWEDGQVAEQLARRFQIDSPSVLLARGDGHPWSALPDRFDVSVVLPAFDTSSLRPDWLNLGGRREAVTVDMTVCIDHLPCLAEARHAEEGEDAIPADQFVVLSKSETSTPLYLAPGRYRLRLLGNDGTPLIERDLTVPAAAAGAAQTTAMP